MPAADRVLAVDGIADGIADRSADGIADRSADAYVTDAAALDPVGATRHGIAGPGPLPRALLAAVLPRAAQSAAPALPPG